MIAEKRKLLFSFLQASLAGGRLSGAVTYVCWPWTWMVLS
jgi:hypothetical protein